MAELSGGSKSGIKTKKYYDHLAGQQVTASTDFHSQGGDPYAADLLRRMYEQAPGITGSGIVRTHD